MADDTGLDKILARLKRLPTELKTEIQPSLDASADEIVRVMKAIAPVSNEADAGGLRDSIHVEPGDHELSRRIVAGAEGHPARYVEFGTAEAAPHPFFWPVWRSLRRRVHSRIARAGSKAVKKITQ